MLKLTLKRQVGHHSRWGSQAPYQIVIYNYTGINFCIQILSILLLFSDFYLHTQRCLDNMRHWVVASLYIHIWTVFSHYYYCKSFIWESFNKLKHNMYSYSILPRLDNLEQCIIFISTELVFYQTPISFLILKTSIQW